MFLDSCYMFNELDRFVLSIFLYNEQSVETDFPALVKYGSLIRHILNQTRLRPCLPDYGYELGIWHREKNTD
jgi:hypothetical protein